MNSMYLEEVIKRALINNGAVAVTSTQIEEKRTIYYIKNERLYELNISGVEGLINMGEESIVDFIKDRVSRCSARTK